MTLHTGNPAPDFELGGLDGYDYALHEACGKGPVLLAFWRADCDTCRFVAPYWNRLYEAYENLTWSFWAISQDPADDAAAFVRNVTFRPTVLVDSPDLSVSRAYDPDSLPTLFLIEPSREISIVSPGWEKAVFEQIAHRVAAYSGEEEEVVLPVGADIPENRPGSPARQR